jgi:hypothetical protein
MKEITTNGIRLLCGWLPPVIPMDPAFIELFAEVPGPNDLLAIALFPQVAPMGVADRQNCKRLETNWSGREDSNLRPPGPGPDSGAC